MLAGWIFEGGILKSSASIIPTSTARSRAWLGKTPWASSASPRVLLVLVSLLTLDVILPEHHRAAAGALARCSRGHTRGVSGGGFQPSRSCGLLLWSSQ